MMFNLNTDFDQDFDEQEAFEYRPGTRVELKQRPGVVDIIAEYDPMMVPPIWLLNDPQPRYPEELTLLPVPMRGVCWLKPVSRRKTGSTGRSRDGNQMRQKAYSSTPEKIAR
ncbi:hypothetical protein [Coleofasciculus sp. FACHB-129]|uniref:hypothetical protein n=1 Tax=Cyanophyceae TaxID=3028117 RepID=UPI001F551004|nr:hypothetical protein [Coleofasciculus sp. FACHB-129]